MKKFLLAVLVVGSAFSSFAIKYEYDNFNEQAKTCRLVGWSGELPSSGKLVLKDTYEKDGVTYKINEIAPGALNHLRTVTEITIGANVRTIGDNTPDNPYRDVVNFNNAPRLERFRVASGNPRYTATGAGILIRTEDDGSKIVVRVPQALPLTTGKLTLGSSITDAAHNSFAENTTITTLVLPAGFNFVNTAGAFTNMRGLKAFEAPSNPYLNVVDGILYGPDRTDLICYPPLREGNSFTVPDNVRMISQNAFLGAQKLNHIDLANVQTVLDNAFAKSALWNVTLPATLTTVCRGAFRECPYLSSVTFDGKHSLERAAFKGCHALTTANLSVDLTFENDSVFEGCGFKRIVFPEGDVPADYGLRPYTFCNNASLETIDLTKLNTTENALVIFSNLTLGCDKLTSVKLPSAVSFGSSGGVNRCTFGADSPVKEITLASFWTVGSPCLLYTEGNHLPRIYLQATGSKQCFWDFQNFFKVTGDATVRPLIFTDAYKLHYNGKETAWYVYPTASYYVPALTRKNYTKAIAAGVTVSEMFELTVDMNSGEVHVVNRYPNDITFQSVSVDGGELEPFDAANSVNLGTELKNGTTLRIYYKFRTTQFKTDYPIAEIATSGIESATTDYAVTRHEVYTLSGTFVAAGDGEADLTALPAGIYVLRSADATGNTTVRKVTNK